MDQKTWQTFYFRSVVTGDSPDPQKVSSGNFTMWDDEKELTVIESMKPSAKEVPSIFKVCQNISNLKKICIIPVVLSHY